MVSLASRRKIISSVIAGSQLSASSGGIRADRNHFSVCITEVIYF